MASRWFWMVAGVNGAGKSTLVREGRLAALLGHIAAINPDEITEQILEGNPGLARDDANLRAAERTEEQVRDKLIRGESFIVETVLSTDKYKSHVENALALGFSVGLIYIALATPEAAIARVRNRVRSGGHDVPDEKIRRRWSRSLDNLAWFAQRVQRLLVYSNDDPRGDPILVADGVGGRVRLLAPDVLPEVTDRLRAIGAAETSEP